MREIRSYGSARGVPGNRHSYRNHGQQYPGIIGNTPGAAWLTARVSCFQITEILVFIGHISEGCA